VCGADSASLYLTVLQVEGQDIICEAQNGAVMDGLMTVSMCYLHMIYFV
jgi:pyruvate kinase